MGSFCGIRFLTSTALRFSSESNKKEINKSTMASQRHIACKLPTKSSNSKKPFAERSHSKNKSTCKKSLDNDEKKTVSTSKIPVPIKGKIRGDGLCNFKGLSLSDASVGTVGTEDKPKTSNSSVAAVSNNVRSFVASEAKVLNVGMDARTNSNVACLMLVKEETDLPATHKKLDEKKTFEYYKEKLAKFGGTDYKETVREIGQQLISDEVLKNYSYLGRRDKFRFKDYDNLTKLVVAATIESVKLRHFEIHGKAMAQSDDEAKKLHDDVEKYFTKEYIKKREPGSTVRQNNFMV